jgi:hypothetical protein
MLLSRIVTSRTVGNGEPAVLLARSEGGTLRLVGYTPAGDTAAELRFVPHRKKVKIAPRRRKKGL